MQKHMKTENILIGPKLNLKIWEHGIKNPPGKVKVTVVKDEKEDNVRVELFGFDFKKKEKKEKQEKPKGLAGKLQEKLGPKAEEAPKAPVTTKKDIKDKKLTAAPAAKPEENKEVPAEVKNEEAPKVEEKKEESPAPKVEKKAEEAAPENKEEPKPAEQK